MKRLGVCVFALAVAVGTARGAVLDQSQEALTGRTTVDVYGSSYVQTFTCGISGKLDHIDLHVQGWEGTGDPGYPTTVAILTVESGEPGSTTLGQVDSCIFELGWNSVDFSSQAVFLSAGTQYGILVENDDANLSGEPTLELSFDWGHDGDPYAGGSLWKGPYGDPPAWHDDYEWIPSNAPVDAAFRTYMVTVPELGPIAHWKLDEGEGTIAYDSAGDNDGTLVNGPVWTPSGINGALRFDGVDDYVSLSNYGVTTTEFTISAWAKHVGPGGGANGTNSIFEQRDDDASLSAKSTIVLFTEDTSTEHNARAFIRDSSGNELNLIHSAENYEEWHHYAMTVGSSDFALYIDGTEGNSGPNSHTGDYITSIDYIDIGRHRYAGSNKGFFNGSIDDVRIYNRALSPEEIEELYLSATPVNYYYVDGVNGSDENDGLTLETAFATIQKGIDQANDADTVLVYPALYTGLVNFKGKAITVRGLATEAGVPIVETPMNYAFSFFTDEEPNSVLTNFVVRNSFSAVFLIDAFPTISNLTIVDNWFGIEAYGSDPDITSCIFYNNTYGDLSGCQATYSLVQDEITDGLVAHWKFDEGEGDTAYDSAGNNDGTIHGAVPAVGQIGGAFDFDGADDYVGVANDSSLNPTSQIAISVWVKPTDWTAGHRRIIQKGFADDQYRFYALGESLDLDLTGVSCGPVLAYLPSLNEWHHLVGTYDASEVSIFMDGQQAESEAATGSINVTTDELNIGVSRPDVAPPGDYFAGLMDDVRIYNRGLSADDVEQIYLTGLGPMFADANGGDYHLLSERGRYWPEHNVWVLDEVTSPCVDGGDPDDNPADERMPNGGRINMGAYGGTPYASMSEWAMTGDVSKDGIVNFKDIAIVAGQWLDKFGWAE